jgi:hypothetical protein
MAASGSGCWQRDRVRDSPVTSDDTLSAREERPDEVRMCYPPMATELHRSGSRLYPIVGIMSQRLRIARDCETGNDLRSCESEVETSLTPEMKRI